MLTRIDVRKKAPTTVSHKPPSPVNNYRVPIECRCQIRQDEDGERFEFALGASCKTERVGVERDIWTDPNADFVQIKSRDRFMNLKSFDRVGKQVMLYPPSLGAQPERQVGLNAEAFGRSAFTFRYSEAEALEAPADIVKAVLDDQRLVARTEISGERYTALLEYPIRGMNASELDDIYQTDTGPVLFPDLTLEPEQLIEGFELAYVAFNAPDWAEFLVRVPTEIADGIEVFHYSRSVRLEAKNQIVQLLDPQ